jgi:hypothetical protein
MLIPIGLLTTVLTLLVTGSLYLSGQSFLAELRAQNLADGVALAVEAGFAPADYIKLADLGQTQVASINVTTEAETTAVQVCLKQSRTGQVTCARAKARSG